MSANNMSDEELDRLFRKTAEQYDPPFDPEAWAAMDRKLTEVQGPGAGIKWRLPLLLLTLLVSLAIIWKVTKEETPLPAKETLSSTLTEGMGSRPSKGLTKDIENAALPEPNASAPQRPEAQAGSGRVHPRRESSTRYNNGRTARRVTAEVASVGATATTQQQPYPYAVSPLPDSSVATIKVHVAKLPITAAPDTGSLVQGETTAAAVLSDSSSQEPDKRKRVFLKSVTVALLLAPDLTTVRFKNPEAVSANAGLLVSLPLTQKFSLVTGAVWANKLYSATAEYYEPYPNFWDGKTVPDDITAKCRVLDIPVNLRYQVLEKGNNILSVQAGLSSYIMLSEKYTYLYNHYGSNPYSKTREVTNENKHWFGVQNLSVGYTRKLSPVFSVGAEPFVKLPLSGIGAGHVKLTSAGIFFTAGFTLQPKN